VTDSHGGMLKSESRKQGYFRRREGQSECLWISIADIEMDANLEKMKACIRATKICLGKTKASRKTGQKKTRAEMKTCLEETKGQSRKDRGRSGAL
jgi:hypothetical protein